MVHPYDEKWHTMEGVELAAEERGSSAPIIHRICTG